VRRPKRPDTTPRLLESLAEGFRFAAANEPIRWSLILLLGLAVFGMQFTILLPLYTRLELGLGPEALGGFFAVYGLGSLVGSVLLAFRQERSIRLEVLAASAVLLVAELILGLTTWLPAVFLLLGACGFFSIVCINTINVTIQQRVTDALRARVMSLYVLVLIGSAPIGALFAGGVAELLRPSAAFVVGAIASAFVLAVAGWRLRSVP
jgi:predicted MFS family arabinose efflux permease